jgi:hypothetical protein
MNGRKFLFVSILFCLLFSGCVRSGILPARPILADTTTLTFTSPSPTSTPTQTRTPTRTKTPTEESPDVLLARIVSRLSAEASRNVLVLVESRLYYGLEEELAVLETDLKNENWAPVLSTFPVNISGRNLREALQQIYSQRAYARVFLVGDFPYVRMWGYSIENDNQPKAADYFYMDLDGEWLDTNKDGFYDVHTSGEGDRDPEIFVGRLSGRNVSFLGESELDMLKAYFHRNHAYRTGNLPGRNAAVYAAPAGHHYGWDAPESAWWSQQEIKSMQGLLGSTYVFIFNDTKDPGDAGKWPGEFWLVGSQAEKTAVPAQERFREIMGEGYDYLSIGIHGWQESWGSDFFTNKNVEEVSSAGGKLPVFVVSNSCSTGDISYPNSMGSILTMAGTLVFLGYSAPSEMRWEEFVYWNASLAALPVGPAFQELQAFATPSGYGPVVRNVNWILLGDPTLRLRKAAS